MTDKGLGQVFHLSLRCICLMLTMVIIVSIVGYVFVIFQSIWTNDIRAEVDRLARTNEKLEDNNERFRNSNALLSLEVDRLEFTVGQLNNQISNFSALNEGLEDSIELLNNDKIELEFAVDNFTEQGAQLQNQVDQFTNQTVSLEETVANLNRTSQRLEDELQLFRELEQNIAGFANDSRGSFESILNSTQELYTQVTESTLKSLQATLFQTINNVELIDGVQTFTQDEYTELMQRFAFVVTETADQLLQDYPFKPPSMTYDQVENVLNQIIESEREKLQTSSLGVTRGWYLELDQGDDIDSFVDTFNRKMLYVM